MIKKFWKDIIFGIFLFSIPFLVPLFNIGEADILIGATASIFAIVTGFFIADAMSNYLRLQTLIAEENAALISIAEDSKEIDSVNYINVHKTIDNYMIAQLNSETLHHVFQTEKEVDQIGVAISKLEVEDKNKEFFDNILSMREKILACRQEISLAAKRNLTIWHWITLVVLAILVVATILSVRDGNTLANLVTGLIIIAIQSILILLREMDNNGLLENKLAYENPREVFHAIMQPPYYPYFSPIEARIPNGLGQYRLGKKEINQSNSFDLVDVNKK